MIGYPFEITNQNGDSFTINDFSTDPLNFIALQDYPSMDVDVKNEEVDREGQHGIWDFFSFYGKRVLTFNGIIIGETEADVESLKKQILKTITLPPIPSSGHDGTVLIKWTDAESEDWQISAKLQEYPRFDRGMKQNLRLRFQLTFKAKFPEIESQTLSTDTGVRGWNQGALILPAELPALIGLVYNNEITVANDGEMEAHTIIRLYGEDGLSVTNPYIFNETTDKLFRVNITLTGSSEWIEIDSKLGTVVDQDGNDKSGLVDGESEYILLSVGDNDMVYLSDESSNASSPIVTWVAPAAAFSVKHRTTII